MVVLDEGRVGQRHAVVDPSTAPHGVLLQPAHSGCRLAGVEYDDAAGGRVDEPPRQRRNAREALQKIERSALGRQQRRCRALVLREDGPRLNAIAIFPQRRDRHGRVELAKCLAGDIESRDDAWRLRHDSCPGPLLARDDSHAARLSRAGFFYALQRWQTLDRAGRAPAWQRCGALQLARDKAEESHMADTMRALDAPPAYAQFVDRDEASARAGVPLRYGGYWFVQGGWMRPASLASANLAAAAAATKLRHHFNTTVARLAFADDEWRALDAEGNCIATAPAVVLANAGDAAHLVDFVKNILF